MTKDGYVKRKQVASLLKPTFSIPEDTMSTNEPVTTGDHPRPFHGFDLPTDRSIYSYGLRHFKYARHWYPSYCALVKVYAELGLHRYNLLEGTNYQFACLKTYNTRRNRTGAAPFYLTLFALNPDSGDLLCFHALVSENRIGRLDISVPISRLKGSREPPRLCRPDYTTGSRALPRWPSPEMFDQPCFYMLNEHEVRNTDWVRVYLDLVHSTCDRGLTQSGLSDFCIVKVAIRSLSDAEEPARLDSKSAVIYMVYKDLAKDRLGEPCYRKAIIRRRYDESSGSLTFQGKHWSFSEEEEKKKKEKEKKRFELIRKRLGALESGVWAGSISTGNVASALLRALVDQ